MTCGLLSGAAIRRFGYWPELPACRCAGTAEAGGFNCCGMEVPGTAKDDPQQSSDWRMSRLEFTE